MTSQLSRLIQARNADLRTAERTLQDFESLWRQQMMPYQIRTLEKHDREVAETAQRLRQEQ